MSELAKGAVGDAQYKFSSLMGEDERWGQIFDGYRSWRYHSKRQERFEFIAKLFSILSFVFSSAAFVAIVGEGEYMKVVACIAAVVSGLNLVFRPSEMARTHRDLRDAFADLLNELEKPDDLSPKELHAVIVKRREIEKKEPPHSRALNAICDYETRMQFSKEVKETPGLLNRIIAFMYAQSF